MGIITMIAVDSTPAARAHPPLQLLKSRIGAIVDGNSKILRLQSLGRRLVVQPSPNAHRANFRIVDDAPNGLVNATPLVGSNPRIDYDKRLEILEEFLDHHDAYRAAEVMGDLWMRGFRECALTGSVALEAQMISRGRSPQRRRLNDLDYVVDGFVSIPSALASRFLVHHVHPKAPRGKLLLQLVDPDRALRIDLFRAFGATMSRANTLDEPWSKLKRVLSMEDLAARYTSHVYGHLREGRPVETKHAESFLRLVSFGTLENVELQTAWQDHRQSLTESFFEARERAKDLLLLHPELLFHQKYSDKVLPCDRCQDYRVFQRGEPALIVNSLGYW